MKRSILKRFWLLICPKWFSPLVNHQAFPKRGNFKATRPVIQCLPPLACARAARETSRTPINSLKIVLKPGGGHETAQVLPFVSLTEQTEEREWRRCAGSGFRKGPRSILFIQSFKSIISCNFNGTCLMSNKTSNV